jgi:copper chaperone CopZ
MGQLQLFVDGMSCRRCVREVTALLRDVPGVETVSANPGDSTVRLTGSMRLDDVLTALTCTDYASLLSHHSDDLPGEGAT